MTEIQAIKDKYERQAQQSLQLDNQIQLLQTEIIEQKRLKGGTAGAIAAQQEGVQHIGKSLKMIETRLERANQKYSEALSQNQLLRD